MIEYDDRDQIPYVPVAVKPQWAEIHRRPGAPCQLRWLAGSEHGRTISLDDTGGIESRVHQSPAGCASRSFRIFLPRGFYLERDGGRARSIVDPRRELPSTKGVL